MQIRDHTGYGERGGQLIFIADVPRGLACGCVCASCGEPLIARKGDKRQHHFAHASPTNCQGATETILHRLAKEILSELTEFAVPPYDYHIEKRTGRGVLIQHQKRVAKGGVVPIHGVSIEKRSGDIVPDIQILSNGNTLLVEVAVTHKVGLEKLNKLRQQNLPAIEISLDERDSLKSRAELREKLQNELRSKAWLFHPGQSKVEQEFNRIWRQAMEYERSHRPGLSGYSQHKGNSAYAASNSTQPRYSEFDRTLEEFNQRHGRYPTMDECISRWPHLWAK